MKKLMGLMALGLSMILLSGCGNDDNDDTPPVPQTIQGSVVGSHYEGAWVCVDSNSNGLCDDDETKTVSDANGNWTLDYPYDSALNVVAEIYVDNIKHSNHTEPLGATLVEKPMIFIAPLQGKVDDQLIVSPISTMVYRSMQENGTTFEVARESVANELGVSEDILLTDYNVENPSSDHIAMQERSDDETEKLGLSMTYHENKVKFELFYSGGDWIEGNYTVTGFYIPSAQDPNHFITRGTVVDFTDDSNTIASLDFYLGRSSSSAVATYWKNRVATNQNNYANVPDKLNFAMEGTFTFSFYESYPSDDQVWTCSIHDFYIAQGHTWTGYNNWWIGGPGCTFNPDYTGVICDCKYGNISQIILSGNSTTRATSFKVEIVEDD